MTEPGDLFDSAWRKWAWAMRHSEVIEAEIAAFASNPDGQPTLETATHYEPRRHAFVVTVTRVPAIPSHWGLLLGDIAHNFRSALDHLAWALVRRGSTPPDTLSEGKQKGVYFPIYSDRARFNEDLPKKLPGVRRADLALVRAHQPYHLGKRKAAQHALAILTEINNFDKHRQLQPTPAVPVSGGYWCSDLRDCEFTDTRRTGHTVALEEGAELRTIRVRRTGPDPDMKVQFDLTTQVFIGERTPVIEWLDKTGPYVYRLLGRFSPPPADLLA